MLRNALIRSGYVLAAQQGSELSIVVNRTDFYYSGFM